MVRSTVFASLLLLGASVWAAPNDPKVRIDPRADAQVRKMSDYLTKLRSFRVRALSSEDLVTKEGQKIQFLADQQVELKRPNRLRVDRHDPKVDTTVRLDGGRLSVFGQRTGYYATVETPPELSKAVDVVRERYGLDAPAADLLMENPYDILMENVVTGRYIGEETFQGVTLHHLAFSGKDVDWQIWIEDGPQPLPRRYSITDKHEKSKPEFTITLMDWEPDAAIADNEFVFSPPPGATRIELRPIGKTERSSR
jgi:hypothetical protein